MLLTAVVEDPTLYKNITNVRCHKVKYFRYYEEIKELITLIDHINRKTLLNPTYFRSAF